MDKHGSTAISFQLLHDPAAWMLLRFQGFSPANVEAVPPDGETFEVMDLIRR